MTTATLAKREHDGTLRDQSAMIKHSTRDSLSRSGTHVAFLSSARWAAPGQPIPSYPRGTTIFEAVRSSTVICPSPAFIAVAHRLPIDAH